MQPWYPFLQFLFAALNVGTVAGNVLTVVAYLKTPHLQNLLICNLSAIDSLVALLAIPFTLFNYTLDGLAFSLHPKFAYISSDSGRPMDLSSSLCGASSP
jgi:hypothetical protein